MYHRKSKRLKRKKIGKAFNRKVRKQKGKNKKYNSYRVSRGGIRL